MARLQVCFDRSGLLRLMRRFWRASTAVGLNWTDGKGKWVFPAFLLSGDELYTKHDVEGSVQQCISDKIATLLPLGTSSLC